ncbi:hypothetical protein QCA50_020877 [Cerrena zonata]|uniref:Uncharacterized protein n=1 Tax=Cerrena zonata TaxID=2478898 RepID=A0AAW0F8H3_9APHY
MFTSGTDSDNHIDAGRISGSVPTMVQGYHGDLTTANTWIEGQPLTRGDQETEPNVSSRNAKRSQSFDESLEDRPEKRVRLFYPDSSTQYQYDSFYEDEDNRFPQNNDPLRVSQQPPTSQTSQDPYATGGSGSLPTNSLERMFPNRPDLAASFQELLSQSAVLEKELQDVIDSLSQPRF